MPTAASVEQFKQWCRDNRPLALAVVQAQAFAELKREQVDAYVKPIFDSYKFQYCGELAERLGKTGPLDSIHDLYLCEDPLVKVFYEDCDKAHREHGFTGPHGHCPALTAEHVLGEARSHLIDLAEPIFQVNSSHFYDSAKRAKFVDLLMRACINVEAQ